jgi:hypothetical protein
MKSSCPLERGFILFGRGESVASPTMMNLKTAELAEGGRSIAFMLQSARGVAPDKPAGFGCSVRSNGLRVLSVFRKVQRPPN